MPRYIEVNALMNYANNQKDKTIDANDIARFPWADVVEVVRCKDCLYWRTETEPIGIECEPGETAHYCAMDGLITRTFDYCSYGHRK